MAGRCTMDPKYMDPPSNQKTEWANCMHCDSSCPNACKTCADGTGSAAGRGPGIGLDDRSVCTHICDLVGGPLGTRISSPHADNIDWDAPVADLVSCHSCAV